MDGRRNHRAGQPQALGDMTLHLRAEHQFRRSRFNGFFHRQIIIADQRVDAIFLGCSSHFAGKFAVVTTEADNLETQFFAGHSCGSDGMGAVAKDEDALAGEIGRIDRARPPAHATLIKIGGHGQPRHGAHFADEFAGCEQADRHGFHGLLTECALQPRTGLRRNLGIETDIEIRLADAGNVGRTGTHGRHQIHINAKIAEQAGDFSNIIAVAEAERGRAQQVGAGPARAVLAHRRQRLALLVRQRPHDLVKGFRRAPIFLAAVAGQFERDDRARQPHRQRQAVRIILDQFSRAAGTDDHRLRLEPIIGVARRRLEQFSGVLAQIAGLKGGVGDGRTMIPPLDHREEQISIGIALRRVQHIMQVAHAGGDAHSPDVGRAFICPDRQLHRSDPQ